MLGCDDSMGVGRGASWEADCAYGVVEDRRRVKVPLGPLLSLRALFET